MDAKVSIFIEKGFEELYNEALKKCLKRIGGRFTGIHNGGMGDTYVFTFPTIEVATEFFEEVASNTQLQPEFVP